MLDGICAVAAYGVIAVCLTVPLAVLVVAGVGVRNAWITARRPLVIAENAAPTAPTVEDAAFGVELPIAVAIEHPIRY